MRTEDLLSFILERHNIYRRRERGEPKPWTSDPILQQFRFCNVYRELDTVTIWIADNWRRPHATDLDLWFAMAVARFVNWPDTLAELGYPVPWNPDHFLQVLEDRKERGEKVFTGAYIIHSDRSGDSKAVYVARKVLTPLWKDRRSLRIIRHRTLARAHEKLMSYPGVGSFMAGQIIADLKYVKPLSKATDWWTWAAPGPGSERGLNRVMGRKPNTRWQPGEWLRCLQELHRQIRPLLRDAKVPQMHGQDVNNCLCEWDKYERFRLGEGKPKQKYPGMA